MWQEYPDPNPVICPKCKKGNKLTFNKTNIIYSCAGCNYSYEKITFKALTIAIKIFQLPRTPLIAHGAIKNLPMLVGRANCNTN